MSDDIKVTKGTTVLTIVDLPKSQLRLLHEIGNSINVIYLGINIGISVGHICVSLEHLDELIEGLNRIKEEVKSAVSNN